MKLMKINVEIPRRPPLTRHVENSIHSLTGAIDTLDLTDSKLDWRLRRTLCE